MEEIIKVLESNENIPYQNLWDTAKAILRGKLIVINAFVFLKKKAEIS
jgi:hypothetical protein